MRFVCRLILIIAVIGFDSALSSAEPAPQFTSQAIPALPAHAPGFTRLTPELTGITFTNTVAESRHLTNQILLNGTGIAAGDVDGDGWCDLYFCALDGPNRLYRNLGNWKFEDITDRAGVACPDLDATGAALVDIDGDGDLDLAVNSIVGGTRIFRNNGHGQFAELTFEPRLNAGKGATSMAWGDLDGDGYLDCYVANYRTSALMDIPNARATFKRVGGRTVVDRVNGRLTTEPDLTNRFFINARGTVEELGEADVLYHNQGGTNFVAVNFTSGVFLDEYGKPLTEPLFDWGLAVMIRDLNGDSRPDIYVCNDFDSPDRIWLNQSSGKGDLKFRAIAPQAVRKTSRFSMGVDFADINRDGFDDFLVLDMLSRDHRLRMTQLNPVPAKLDFVSNSDNRPQYMMNTLALNRGDGTYAEIAQFAGLAASDWSWMPLFLDVDLDGWEDILISNGQERAARDLDVADELQKLRAARALSDSEIFEARRKYPRLAPANVALRNRRDLTFEDASVAWNFAETGVAQGMLLADLDNDGDADVVVSNFNAPPSLYRNDSSAPRVAVKLRGRSGNSHGIGARVTVRAAGLPAQTQEIIAGGRYLSSDQAERTFAAGQGNNRVDLEVRWPSGAQSRLPGVEVNRIYEITEPVGTDANSVNPGPEKANQPMRPALFEDVSGRVVYVHQDAPFDDMTRQPLLPRYYSTLGPGVAWFDLDGDGRDDLMVSAGKGGRLGVFRNRTNGFERLSHPALNQPVTREQTATVGFHNTQGQPSAVIGLSNYDDGLAVGAVLRQINFIDHSLVHLADRPEMTGPIALADIDADGDLDLFVGGRLRPGNFPLAADSLLYRATPQGWVLDATNSLVLKQIGLVSAAIFTDLDGDGDPDLVLAQEWGPVRILRNQRGLFSDATEALGLNRYSGWWNGVAVGDFDGDGRLDLVASNWGRNTPFESHRGRPLQLVYGEFSTNNVIDMIEAYWDPDLNKNVPERQLSALVGRIPDLRQRFGSNRAYAEASVEELLGAERSVRARVLQANWLDSSIFLNRGDHFECRPLPPAAQYSPAFGIAVADFDGDGQSDLVLAQNFFGVRTDLPRYDAGRGLCLLGDGHGGFRPLDGGESGLMIYGEQRGCAVSDFDGDGRPDLVVAQHNGTIVLLRNQLGVPSLRVRCKGLPVNPTGVGAMVRAVSASSAAAVGPVYEVHAGGGYWSQDSAVILVPGTVTRLSVRFPASEPVLVNVPAGSQEIEVDRRGSLRVIK